MALKENYNNDPLCFLLIDKMPGSDLQIVGQASTEAIRDNWIVHIRNLLDMQGDFLRGEGAFHIPNFLLSQTVSRAKLTYVIMLFANFICH